MLNLLRVRINQGFQTIKDIRNAKPPEKFRGLPVVDTINCEQEKCAKCADLCPTGAITVSPLQIDLCKCLFCPDCQTACPEGVIEFTNNPRVAATEPDSLLIRQGKPSSPVVKSTKEIRGIFKRSLKLRSVSAGGCNGCEMELNAASNVHFDMARFGFSFTASPRHADALVLSGPMTRNMTYAFEQTYKAIAEPKMLILFGACALSGGLFRNSSAIERNILNNYKISLYVPGCPPHPLTFVNGLLDLVGAK